MILNNLRWWPPEKLSKYPHLSVADSEIANLYWKSNFFDFQRACYDITVGFGRSFDPNAPLNLQTDWRYLTSLKIDMLGLKENDIYIVEFKSYGDPKGIGQLLCYRKLFDDKFAPTNNTLMCLICNRTHPDIITVANFYNIKILLVDTSFPPQFY